jgi:hypothetical protein
VSANDFELAERAVREARLKRSLNPRQRVIELWRGAPAAAPVTLSSLRAFQHAALQPDKHLVVYVKERS